MNRTLFTIVGASAVIALLLFVMPASLLPQSGQAKITWSPPNVYAGITSTSTVIKSVTFASDQTLQNVVVEAVPKIAGFIQIQPNTLGQVPASQPQTVRLIFSAPTGAQFGAFDGTIHLRVGNTTLPQTLKTSVTFAVVPLPPDPGDAGKTTLQGIDSDADGVRDDVQRFIVLGHPESEKTREAMKDAAKALQAALLTAGNTSLTRTVSTLQRKAAQCLSYIRPDDTDIINSLVVAVINTEARLLANNLFESHLVGGLVDTTPAPSPASRKFSCSFTVDAMEN